eukprot:TRINITY_DN9296_c0_g1_i1.p1 TRINITY_DN9296_c0_g1~~TRINITY_DN9296_c0_g1_i1.p1  ORF type:complete len:367 (-),score=46.93 TRINITY_DN9296_c0_g1_i1:102-1202(-)
MELLTSSINLATAITALGGTGAATMAFGVRFGVGSACSLALRSWLRGHSPKSLRPELPIIQAQIRDLRLRLNPCENFIVIVGPKGVGKSCAVGTALSHTIGVVKVGVTPGSEEANIVLMSNAALCHVQDRPFFMLLGGSTRRTLWCFRAIFRQKPVVVLEVHEVKAARFAEVAAAARTISGQGVTVVIDASTNSLDDGVMRTLRSKHVVLKTLPWEHVCGIPEFQLLVESLRRFGLEEATQRIIGGNLAALEVLALSSAQEITGLLEEHIDAAIAQLGEACQNEAVVIMLNAYSTVDEVQFTLSDLSIARKEKIFVQLAPYTFGLASPVQTLIIRKFGLQQWFQLNVPQQRQSLLKELLPSPKMIM